MDVVNRLLPVAYCPDCKTKTVVGVTKMVHESIEHVEVTTIFCPWCDLILNYDQEVELEWMTRFEVKEELGIDVVERGDWSENALCRDHD